MDSPIKTDYIGDEILRIVKQYKNHHSIAAIKNENLSNQFTFRSILRSEIKKEILNLDISKAFQDSYIPTKIIIDDADIFANILHKEFADIFANILHKEFDRSLEVNKFPLWMKLSIVNPVHKKGSQSEKGIYRPVSFWEMHI